MRIGLCLYVLRAFLGASAAIALENLALRHQLAVLERSVTRRHQVRLDGAAADVRAFPLWFAGSRMAETVRAALADRGTAAYRAAAHPRSATA